MRAVAIRQEPIKLSQFLKLADIIMNGAEAKLLLEQNDILVNGSVETRRGRKLYRGDFLEFKGERYEVVLLSDVE
jgi:ribosome-associated protein